MNFFRKTVLFFSRPLHICRLRLLYFPIRFGHEPVRIVYPATLVRIGSRAVGHCYGIQFSIFQICPLALGIVDCRSGPFTAPVSPPIKFGCKACRPAPPLLAAHLGPSACATGPCSIGLNPSSAVLATAPSRTIYSASPCRCGVFCISASWYCCCFGLG